MTSIEDSYWAKVVVGMECWGWSASVTKGGYGSIRDRGRHGKDIRAHRLSYMLHVGAIPPGMMVLHKCDNPPCSNPAHLFLGTAADNNRDMWAKGRGKGAVMGDQRHTKLTPIQVAQVRALYESGEWKQCDLAKAYGVAQSQISNITSGKQWL